MATIYSKLITGVYEKCIILDRFEGFQYPLPSEMKNWNEIRIGLYVSYTNNTEDNGIATNSVLNSSTVFTPTNTPWIGLKTNNDIFPGNDGCSFIGIGTLNPKTNIHYHADSPHPILMDIGEINLYSQGAIPFIMGSGLYTNPSYKNYNDSYLYNNAYPKGAGILTSGTTMTGSVNPIVPISLKFTRVSGSAINYQYKVNINSQMMTIPISETSIESLRSFMSNFSFSSTSYNVYQKQQSNTSEGINSDPFTSDGTISGAPIPNPDSLFIYWPFDNARMRIHNFCVEKYA